MIKAINDLYWSYQIISVDINSTHPLMKGVNMITHVDIQHRPGTGIICSVSIIAIIKMLRIFKGDITISILKIKNSSSGRLSSPLNSVGPISTRISSQVLIFFYGFSHLPVGVVAL